MHAPHQGVLKKEKNETTSQQVRFKIMAASDKTVLKEPLANGTNIVQDFAVFIDEPLQVLT